MSKNYDESNYNECKSCCCGHEHDKNCWWEKYALNNGYQAAHELHSGKCSCEHKVNIDGNKLHKIATCDLYHNFTK